MPSTLPARSWWVRTLDSRTSTTRGRLLLHHAGGHGHAKGEQGDVEQDHPQDEQGLGALVPTLVGGGVQGAHRRRGTGQDLGGLPGGQPGVLQPLPQAEGPGQADGHQSELGGGVAGVVDHHLAPGDHDVHAAAGQACLADGRVGHGHDPELGAGGGPQTLDRRRHHLGDLPYDADVVGDGAVVTHEPGHEHRRQQGEGDEPGRHLEGPLGERSRSSLAATRRTTAAPFTRPPPGGTARTAGGAPG